MPLYGEGAKNKNLALFQEKSREVCHAFQNRGQQLSYVFRQLHSGTILLCFRSPVFHGNSRKLGIADLRFGPRVVGNYPRCGSHETILLGASLFDLDDPSKEIGRLKDPCFRHEKMNEKVMYPMSCNSVSIIHNNSLILPCRIGPPSYGW
jgi:hypothetical protein